VAAFGPPQWLPVIYLGLFGSALTFYLWAFALSRTTPTLIPMVVNGIGPERWMYGLDHTL
jgi:drug/metabolite transporter (DMT)-like permease